MGLPIGVAVNRRGSFKWPKYRKTGSAGIAKRMLLFGRVKRLGLKRLKPRLGTELSQVNGVIQRAKKYARLREKLPSPDVVDFVQSADGKLVFIQITHLARSSKNAPKYSS